MATASYTEFCLLNRTFHDTEKSIYTLHATDAADVAWTHYDQSLISATFLVPKDSAAHADLDPSRHIYLDYPERNLVGYRVLLEATHQLHCLNKLRTSLYYNVEHYSQQPQEPWVERNRQLHVERCLDMLRMWIACTADLGVVPFVWLRHDGGMVRGMASTHTYADYKKVGVAGRDTPVDLPRPGVGLKPRGDDFVVDDFI
jgi:hypothetical protein